MKYHFHRHTGLAFLLAISAIVLSMPSLMGQISRKWTDVRNTVTDGSQEKDFNKAAIDAVGNVYTAGVTDNLRTTDWILRKTAAGTGALLWENRFVIAGYTSTKVAAVAVDSNGDFLVTGSPYSSHAIILTAKFSGLDGTLIWQKRFIRTSTSDSNAYAMAVSAAGDVVVTGTTRDNFNNEDIYTAKYSGASGALIWERRYSGPANGNDYGKDVKIDPTGNIIITGYSDSTANRDIYTAKYAASNGAIIWAKRFGGGQYSNYVAERLALDAAGNAYVTGMFILNGGPSDAITLKFAADSGQTLWERRFDGEINRDDGFSNIAIDLSGNVVVIGYTQFIVGNSAEQRYIAKYSGATGAILWESRDPIATRYNSPLSDQLDIDANGDVLTTGHGYDASNREVTVTSKRSGATGSDLWRMTYTWQTSSQSFQVRNIGYTAIFDPAGDVIISGISTNPKGSPDYLTLKYSATGTLLWTDRYDGSYSRDNGAFAVTIDSAGNTITAGYSVNELGDNDIHFWKNDATTGALLWEQRYRSPSSFEDDDESVAVSVDGQNNVIVAGKAGAKFYLAKHAASNGAQIWQKILLPTDSTYGSVRDMAVDATGNIFVTGSTSKGFTGSRFFTSRYSSAGSLIWERFTDSTTSSGDFPVALVLDVNGNVVVTGEKSTLSSRINMYTVKYSSTGTKLWDRSYSAPASEDAHVRGIDTDPYGNVVITGMSGAAVGVDMYTAKYAAATGAIIWEKNYKAPSGTSFGTSVVSDSNGDIFVGGSQRSTRPETLDYDCYVAKYASTDGSLLWSKIYDRVLSGNDEAPDLVVDGDNNLWMAAKTETGSELSGLDISGIAIVKYAGSNGVVLGSELYNGETTDQTYGYKPGRYAIAAGGGNRVAVIGFSLVPGPDLDAFTLLYEMSKPQLVVEDPLGSPLASGAFVNFGLVPQGESRTTKTFTIRNTGSGVLNVSDIFRSDGNSGPFIINPVSSPNIAAGGTGTFKIDLLSTSVGTYAMNLALISNDPNRNPFTLTLTFTVPSRNASLASLTLDSGSLSPSFSGTTLVYRTTIPFSASTIRLTPTAEDTNAVVLVNGSPVTSGTQSMPVEIPVGTTTVTTTITAQDVNVQQNYQILVTRLLEFFEFDSTDQIPVSADGFSASGQSIDLRLNFKPPVGAALTAVQNTGSNFIQGAFENLPQGTIVTLDFNGVSYRFAVNYYGGSGNDLVLLWADTAAATWGSNRYGQLGTGGQSAESELSPVAVQPLQWLSGKTIFTVSSGYLHNLALLSDGTVTAWGYNIYGQLGNGGTELSRTPTAVDRTGALAGKTVIAISAGPFHNLALCSDGDIAAWGYNHAGQLGDGSKITRTSPVLVDRQGALAGKTVISVAAGAYQSFALCSDGTIAAWGYNDEGELGNGSTMASQIPVKVGGVLDGKTVTSLAAGAYHALAICSDGTMAAWGYNGQGQLGDGSVENRLLPILIESNLGGKHAISVSAGHSHSLALFSDSTVFACGSNADGQLGDGSRISRFSPGPVNLSGFVVSAISAAETHSLARCSDGSLVGWGNNSSGQLGNGTTVANLIPSAVNDGDFGQGGNFIQVSGSSSHGVALVAIPDGLILEVPSPDEMPEGTSEVDFATWKKLYFPDGKSTGAHVSGDLDDPDGDGLANLMEYAFGRNPRATDPDELPQWQRIGDEFVLDFIEPTSVTGITYSASVADDPSQPEWSRLPNLAEEPRHLYRVPVDRQRRFMRIEIDRR